MIASATNGYDRVRAHTATIVNERLDRCASESLQRAADDAEFARERIASLDREWELDRVILLAFAAAGAVALTLGLRRDRRWKFPLAAQIAFMLAHSLVGWCPPAALLRRIGFRTRQEIDAERAALTHIRSAST